MVVDEGLMGIQHELQPSRPEEPGRGSSCDAAMPISQLTVRASRRSPPHHT